jgi:hypothetical protein
MLSKPKKWLKPQEKHLNRSKKHPNGLREPLNDVSKRLVVNKCNSKATASSSDLLFIKKGSNKYIPTVKRAVPHSWYTSNGTFQIKKVGEINISLVKYSTRKGSSSSKPLI